MSRVKRGKIGTPMKSFSLFENIKNWRRFSMTAYNICQYDTTKVAQYRLEIIKFFEEFGLEPTKRAFKVSKSTIYRWRKILKDNKGKLSSLIPQSTRPKRTRKMITDPRIINFIKTQREEHPKLGKEKLKPILDEYCEKIGIPSVSASTIGKILKRNNYFFQKSGRIYHNPSSGWAKRKNNKRLRVRYSPEYKESGHFEMDSVTIFVDGMRRYILSAIDTYSKFSFSACYASLSSRNAKDFVQKLGEVYPGKIKSIQTDNGSEFLGECDEYLKKKSIIHYFTYPKCPRINGIVERYQRTLQEEFVSHSLDIIHDIKYFNIKMAEYLIWYNTKRPHKSLGLKSPINYLIEKNGFSQMYITHTKT
jgi:transposase InsO family protein